MSADNWFWIIYVLSIVFTGVVNWPADRVGGYRFGYSLVVMILIGILGYRVFHAPIQ